MSVWTDFWNQLIFLFDLKLWLCQSHGTEQGSGHPSLIAFCVCGLCIHVHTHMCIYISVSSSLFCSPTQSKTPSNKNRDCFSGSSEPAICLSHRIYTRKYWKEDRMFSVLPLSCQVFLLNMISVRPPHSAVMIHRPPVLWCLRSSLPHFIHASECHLIKGAALPPISLCPLTPPYLLS